MTHIDLHMILQTVGPGGYGDLVTRRTGQAVRNGIEPMLADHPPGDLALVDFSTVRLIDYSCADEIVGQLLLRHGHAQYFLLVGVRDHHLEAIEPVLERHGLAVVAQDHTGRIRLLGRLPEDVMRVYAVLVETGGAEPAAIAEALGLGLDTAKAIMADLLRRRLVRPDGPTFRPLMCA
jgi:hypothetical protein